MWILLFLCLFFSSHAAPNNNQQQKPAVNNNNNTITNNFNPIIVIDAKFLNALVDYKKNIQDQCHQFFDRQKDLLHTNINSLHHWIVTNKLRCALWSAGTLYGIVNGYLWYIKNQLDKHHCWSRWQSEKSLEELFAIPQNNLAQSLLFQIQQHYTHATKPTDFLQPLIHFMNDLEQEVRLLTLYQRLSAAVASCHLTKFSIVDEAFVAAIDNRLKRLAYLKGLFLSWIAQYKLEHPGN